MPNKDEGDFLTKFLDLIQTHMLVVNPLHGISDGEYRFSCQRIYQRLGQIGRIIGLKDDMYDNDDDDEDDSWRHPIRYVRRHISTGSSSRLEEDE